MLGGRDTCQRWARRGPADDTLAMEHKIEEALLPWSKNRRQITEAGKRRAQKAGGRRAKTFDQVTGGVRLAEIYWLEAACRVFATVSWKRVLAADANGGNSCLLKSHSAKPLRAVSSETYPSERSMSLFHHCHTHTHTPLASTHR